MTIRARASAVVGGALCLASLTAARGQDESKVPADWKCNARKVLGADQRLHGKVGDAVSEERDETESRRMREGEAQTQDDETTLHFQRVALLVAQDEAAKTKEIQYRYSAWRRAKEGAPDDTSLEGKIVVVRKTKARQTFFVVGPDGARAKASDGAMAWVRKEHGGGSKLSEEDEKKLERIAPEDPVAPEGEWTGDPRIVSEALLDAAPIDLERSSVKGKLTNVRREGGTILGKVSVDMRLQLKLVPTTTIEWSEGGLAVMKLEQDGTLEDQGPLRFDQRMVMRVKGKVAKGGGQFRAVDFEVEGTRKLRSAKAPEALKLAFDPDAEYRWNVAGWASGDEPATKARVGDRSFFEIESTSTSRVLVNGKETSNKKTVISARFELEVVSVAGKAIGRKAGVARWSYTEGDVVDESLDGKTVILTPFPKPGQPAYQVLDSKGQKIAITPAAQSIIESELVRTQTRAIQLDNLQELLGNEDVAPESDIAIDPRKAAKKLFGDGQEIDAASTGTARLAGVKAVGDDHEGKLEAHLALKLKTIPGAPGGRFDDPGACDMTFSFEGSLDRGKTGTGTATVTMDYTGKGKIPTKNGVVTFEPTVTTKRVIKSGALPRSGGGKEGSKEPF